MTQQPETLTPREFAARLGYKPHYGNQLAKDGRLVFAPDGKRVLVQESIARFNATKDPSRQGVADRHAAGRVGQGDAAANTKNEAEQEEEVGKTYHASKAIKEKYLALAARRDYEKSIKLLTCTHDVYFHVENAFTVCRVQLERIPSSLAPQLAAINNESEINTLLTNHIEHILSIMSNEIAKLGD